MFNSRKTGNVSRSKISYFGWALLAPVIVLSVVFAILQVAPFGSKSLLVSDLATQYLPFFADLRTQLLHHSLSSYSFLISIGDGMLPIYTYYLMSPFNLIIVFFSKAQLPVAINMIIWLKVVLSSVSMSSFLHLKYKATNLVGVAAGIAYGLCGFVAMYFYDLMWLDALILLPWVVYGLERLVKQQKSWLYLLALTATIITNYYMGYIICVFAVIYFIYLLMKERPAATPWSPYLTSMKKTGWRFIWFSLLAGMLSAVLLVPTVLAMLSTGKGSFSWTNFLPYPTFGPSVLVNLGVGASNFYGRLSHGPSLFTGSFFLIGVLVYFWSKNISRSQKKSAGWLILAVLVGMWVETSNTIWHMFQQPAGFPFRMVYLFSFVVIMLTYEGYLQGMFADFKLVKRAAGTIMALILIGYAVANVARYLIAPHLPAWRSAFMTYQYFVSNWYIIWAAVFLVVTVLVIKLVPEHPKGAQWIILLLVGVEMGTNFLLANQDMPLMNTKSYSEAFQRADAELKHPAEKQFYRTTVNDRDLRKAFPVDYNGYNDSLIFGNRSVNSYSSTLNANTWHVLSSLGFASRNIRRIGSMGATPVTAQLLGLKYNVIVDGSHSKTFVNSQTSGLGFMTDSAIETVKFNDGEVFANLNALVNAETGRSVNPFVLTKLVQVKKSTHDNQFHYRLVVESQINGKQWLYIPGVRLKDTEVKINGRQLNAELKGLGTQTVDLGKAVKGQRTVVEIGSQRPLTDLRQLVATFDQHRFDRSYRELNRNAFAVQNAADLNSSASHFTGTVTATKKRPVLLISLPYNDGWQVTEDGKALPTTKVADGLLGVKLTPGYHHLKFSYQVQGLKLGMVISIMGGLLALGTVIWHKRKKWK